MDETWDGWLNDINGFHGHPVLGLPHDGLRQALKKYGRLLP